MKYNYMKNSKRITFIIIIMFLCTSLWLLSSAGWIQAKAVIAQQLLNHSWDLTLKYSGKNKPWPWADTWPVAKLTVPYQDIEQIVLAGDSGSSLAFGPGYSLASAAPNTAGTTVISGHRDTHFQFLQKLKINDKLTLQTNAKKVDYQIYDRMVVSSKEYTIQTETDLQTLILVTCYPFNSISTGGPLRYLVFARPLVNDTINQHSSIQMIMEPESTNIASL